MNQTHRAVAIDGPAASGKSTVAQHLAAQLGLVMINTGAMYRAVTWEILHQGIDPADSPTVLQALQKMTITGGVENGISTIAINTRTLSDELRSEAVNHAVSIVASLPEVRQRLVAMQRQYLEQFDLVMEGRDIGSVVFPDTPYKLYIDASEEVRAARRSRDGEADAVAARDARDSQRKASPLKVADGAIVIDSSHLSIEETVDAAHRALVKLGWKSVS